MELVNQKTKAIMEGCKERARNAGLRFQDESLEYIVTNRDMIELSPKVMIPTMYDYWVHDVEVLKGKGKYELYPSNPYETVINTRPAISFYNDNNPDWLNVMIFYHVLAHIDFFQNNAYYTKTWNYDFTGRALADKRIIAKLRSEKGRWVDYIIEFARGIDNLVGYHSELNADGRAAGKPSRRKLDYYFDVFLQDVKKVSITRYIKELDRYNECVRDLGEKAEPVFFAEVLSQYPEFESMLERYLEKPREESADLMQHILNHSLFLKREENSWMRSVVEIVRSTSLYFQPQIRTKIMNEGWASYWHETLFLADDRISGHEVEFARVNAGVTALPRVGLNPYALGLRLFNHIEELGDTGRYSLDYRMLPGIHERTDFDTGKNDGRNMIFRVREQLNDFLFIENYLDQEFVDKNKLFVSGRRLNPQRMVWEYYVKSRNAEAYKKMMRDALYHPPYITVKPEDDKENTLNLVHHFEGKPLITDFISNTLMGIEYLWGGPVKLETHEVVTSPPKKESEGALSNGEIRWERVEYTMKGRKLSRSKL